MLPDDVQILSEARNCIDLKTDLFINEGAAQLEKIIECNNRIEALKVESETDFPMNEADIADLRAEIRRQVEKVHDAEEEAVMALKAAIA